jgi:hypothetical protein
MSWLKDQQNGTWKCEQKNFCQNTAIHVQSLQVHHLHSPVLRMEKVLTTMTVIHFYARDLGAHIRDIVREILNIPKLWQAIRYFEWFWHLS